MTDIDYRIEDGSEKGRPNYTLRRVKFAAAVVGLIVSVTLMLTWHGGLTGALVVEGVYLATALWLTVRFAPRDDVDGVCGFESRRRRLAGPSTPPASPFRSAFLGCGNDGRDYLLSWRPAVRLISINLVSINQGQGRNR